MQQKVERIHFMDPMRAVLMMLGVVLHSCNVFSPAQEWLIYGSNTIIIADYIVHAIHIFRMPAFFVVAGFFCILTIKKYKPKKFLEVRVKRIVIPLLFTALTLNSLQVFILVSAGFYQFDLSLYILNGGWVSHLWFLNTLVFYFALATIIAIVAKKPIQYIGKVITNLFSSIPLLLVILIVSTSPLLIYGSYKLGAPLYSNFMGVLKMYDILIHLPYFAFGAILALNKDLLYRFSTFNPIISLSIIICSLLLLLEIPTDQNLVQLIAHTYLSSLIVWLSVSICFYLFHVFLNKPSKKWLFLSGASYSVFLFHHVTVIGLGVILINLNTPALIGLPLLIALTLLITFAIHNYVILRFSIARYLFNGK